MGISGISQAYIRYISGIYKAYHRKISGKKQTNILHILGISNAYLRYVRHITGRARKSIVSWYPGYQPISNLAANFGLGRKPSQPAFESKQPITGWIYHLTSHQTLVKSQSVAELRIQASIHRNKQIIKN